MIQLVRGFRDILPDEVESWKHIENIAAGLFTSFGFREIRTPILENTALFQRSIGEHTDIVEKEMYTFPGSRDAMLTLRPEATASVVRAYIQQRLYAVDPVQKLYTIGPMFRRERPQKGRYRQFYQINAEVFGIASPLMDAQLIVMLNHLFAALDISGLSIQLNSLGCPACRPDFKAALSDRLKATDGLCGDCLRRRETNPMRVLDCKVPSCQAVIADAPVMADYLCDDCARHFKAVTGALDGRKIAYVINHRLVRGLDYYCRTAFEFQTAELGAQNAVAGGGRYDGLVATLGGPAQPAIGFAVGMDRLVELLHLTRPPKAMAPNLFIAAIGDRAATMAYDWSCDLSLAGVNTEIDFSGKSLKALMKRADRFQAPYVLIAGDQELDAGAVIVRDMKTKAQESVPMDRLVGHVRKLIDQKNKGLEIKQ
jgi:histidyl-tRNA synthetase